MFIKLIDLTTILLILSIFLTNTAVIAMYDPEEVHNNLLRFPPKELVLDNFDPESTLSQKQDFLKSLSSEHRKKAEAFLKNPYTKTPFSLILFLFTDRDYFESFLDSLSLEKDMGKNSRLTFFTPEIVTLLPIPSYFELTERTRQWLLHDGTQGILKPLKGIPDEKLPDLIDFFTNNPRSRSNKSVVKQMIYWSQILNLRDMHHIVEPVLQWSPFNNGPFSPDAPFDDSPLYPYLKEVETPLVRGQICSIFLKNTSKGKYSLEDLSKDYSARVIPELAKLSSRERLDIEDFFTSEVIEAVKENRIFLQVLDRLIRPVTEVTKRRKNEWSEKMVVENIYGHYTQGERLKFMRTLTPKFLKQVGVKGFYKIIDPEAKDVTDY